MGITNHNAIIATTFSPKEATRIQEWIGGALAPTQPGLDAAPQLLFTHTIAPANGFVTFVLTPDGSNEGWGLSDWADTLRAEFIAALKQGDYDDGSSPWSWVEVGYGEYGEAILQGNNINRYNDLPYADQGANNG